VRHISVTHEIMSEILLNSTSLTLYKVHIGISFPIIVFTNISVSILISPMLAYC
jgi:hypothetical protein